MSLQGFAPQLPGPKPAEASHLRQRIATLEATNRVLEQEKTQLQHCLQRPFLQSKKPIPYWGLETERDISDKKTKEKYRIRLVYIFSHQRRQVIRHTRAKNFLKAKAALHKINRCLNKYDYKTERIILARLQSQVLRKCPYYRYELHKDSDGLFSIAYWIDWQQLADDEMFDGIYVLKTNAPKAWFSMNVILETYKGQPHVERCFETVKQPPICVSPVWLHKAQRIESLLFLVFLALLVISVEITPQRLERLLSRWTDLIQ